MTVGRRLLRELRDGASAWRSGSETGQENAMTLLVLVSSLMFVASLTAYEFVPAVSFVVPLIVGSLLLRYRHLKTLTWMITAFAAIAVTKESLATGMTWPRASSLVTMSLVIGVFLFEARRRRTGVPAPIGEAMLADLNERLQRQGRIPQLPPGWQVDSATRAADGANFSGDFMVARTSRDGRSLEMILVDVCGKGVTAGTQSLQFAGAIGGLVGRLTPRDLLDAANDYLMRQEWDEGFATAVHVALDLVHGDYVIHCAGHPPMLQWKSALNEWLIDDARGIALGLTEQPEFHRSVGTVAPGDVLLFFTDGVVETRSRGVSEGLPWLQRRASDAIAGGFTGSAGRLLDCIIGDDDDRAVLMLRRA